MDETYIRVGSEWKYLYRAVDKAGKQSISRCEPIVTRLRPGATSKRRSSRTANRRP